MSRNTGHFAWRLNEKIECVCVFFFYFIKFYSSRYLADWIQYKTVEMKCAHMTAFIVIGHCLHLPSKCQANNSSQCFSIAKNQQNTALKWKQNQVRFSLYGFIFVIKNLVIRIHERFMNFSFIDRRNCYCFYWKLTFPS